jgi:putative ABC transport system permease protein
MRLGSRGHLKAGLDSVRNAKLRSFWTMLGVIIGVASVISVVAIGQGVKQQISQQITHSGKSLITVRPAQLQAGTEAGDQSIFLSGLNVNGPLTNKDVLTVSKVPGVTATAPLSIASGTVKGATGVYKDGFVIGTSSDLPSLLNHSVAEGIFLEPEDTDQFVAVLGEDAAQKMFDQDVPLGRTFTMNGQEFIVKGIFNRFTTTPLSQQANYNNAIFIPYNVAQELTKNTASTYEILARAANEDQTDRQADKIEAALNKAHGGSSGLSVLTGDESVAANSAILDLLTRLIAGVAAISLLVGGIGIMNVMLVSVAERMHEIGIRKAIGATNRQILNQFMIESTVLSVAGGVIGIFVAGVITLTLRLTTSLQPVISWQVVLIATGVSLAVGIIFGTVPAIKAARKDPIEALRSE